MTRSTHWETAVILAATPAVAAAMGSLVFNGILYGLMGAVMTLLLATPYALGAGALAAVGLAVLLRRSGDLPKGKTEFASISILVSGAAAAFGLAVALGWVEPTAPHVHPFLFVALLPAAGFFVLASVSVLPVLRGARRRQEQTQVDRERHAYS